MAPYTKILRYYVNLAGKIPFLRWLNGLKDPLTQARIWRRIDRMEMGHYGDYKSIGDGVYELKLDFGPGYRIYFAEQHSNIIILLYGGDKSTQKNDTKMARMYWNELLERIND